MNNDIVVTNKITVRILDQEFNLTQQQAEFLYDQLSRTLNKSSFPFPTTPIEFPTTPIEKYKIPPYFKMPDIW
jgi:hypothetical protein